MLNRTGIISELIWGTLVLIGISNLGIPIPISPIIIIIINDRLAKLDKQQAGNSVEIYFSIKYAGIALINIKILLLSMPT